MKEETYEPMREKQRSPERRPAFSALVSSIHGVPVVRVRGEIDLATTPKLLKAIGIAGSHLDGRPILVVDLRETGFLDVTGLHSLVEETQAMRGLGGELRVVATEEGPVARVFELLGADQMIDLRYELELSPDGKAS